MGLGGLIACGAPEVAECAPGARRPYVIFFIDFFWKKKASEGVGGVANYHNPPN